eukprot:CAMPEP_0196574456 /NCGR_PEP_ID=MMETSP1081-20130531/4167_1 /TAXON_ID=36882 /ORGANISM="Pyramimonas amylifera, Strain CCMP720" /LENGTH=347 /DNA_ID=CAMNT_0041892481 /DNA_START=282 /DNA_END=1325 /DNA_ORIENTATION=-
MSTSKDLSEVKPRSALDEMAADGAFKRVLGTQFRSWIEEGGRFPPASGRYHLYIAYACPWATRCLAVLYMKGLQDTISLSVVHPTWAASRPDTPDDIHRGWQFADPTEVSAIPSPQGCGSFSTEGCIPDTVNGCKFVRDLYEIAEAKGGKYTVPILWDKQQKTLVSNESSEILRMLNSVFNSFAKHPALDLYPEPLRAKIDEINEWTYEINDGVYRCGFAQTQRAYDEAEEALFKNLDRAEQVLSTQRYLAGSVLTEADIRLYVTLVRFDEVYVVYFKTNRKCIREYPNLFNYTKDIYQTPGVGESTNMEHIKNHYFSSHEKLNTYAIVPRGPGMDFSSAHDRDRFG